MKRDFWPCYVSSKFRFRSLIAFTAAKERKWRGARRHICPLLRIRNSNTLNVGVNWGRVATIDHSEFVVRLFAGKKTSIKFPNDHETLGFDLILSKMACTLYVVKVRCASYYLSLTNTIPWPLREHSHGIQLWHKLNSFE